MTIARKVFSAGAALAASMILAGCMTGGGGGGGSAKPVETGVEGTWMAADGTALQTIRGGIFATNAVDTGQKLAEGTYTLTGANSVLISGISLLRQSRGEPANISFNCLLVSSNQLNCTSLQGSNFVLTRRT